MIPTRLSDESRSATFFPPVTFDITPAEQFAADVKSAWAEVFPKSRLSVGAFAFGGIGVTGYLAGSKEEVANGIWQNDMLIYGGWFESNGNYKEGSVGLTIRPPAGSHLVYGRAKLRCKTIKNVDRAKLVKRFIELRDFIREHKDETIRLCFDINEKLEA